MPESRHRACRVRLNSRSTPRELSRIPARSWKSSSGLRSHRLGTVGGSESWCLRLFDPLLRSRGFRRARPERAHYWRSWEATHVESSRDSVRVRSRPRDRAVAAVPAGSAVWSDAGPRCRTAGLVGALALGRHGDRGRRLAEPGPRAGGGRGGREQGAPPGATCAASQLVTAQRKVAARPVEAVLVTHAETVTERSCRPLPRPPRPRPRRTPR